MNGQPYEPQQNGFDPNGSTQIPPQYTYVYGEQKKPANGFAVASLVLGILGLLCCCLWYVSLAFGALAIAFAIIHRKQAGSMNGMAIAGLTCGAVGAVIALFLVGYSIVLTLVNPNWMDEFLNENPPTALFRYLFK